MGIAVDHRTFVITRDLPGRPGHAFRFWSDHALKRRWSSCHPDWTIVEDSFDFRIGHGETLVWAMPDGTVQAMRSWHLEIHPRERIVYAYVMETGGLPISSSLVTVELDGRADGTTRMTFTEQAVFGDPADGDIRESGTGVGFDRLCAEMARLPA